MSINVSEFMFVDLLSEAKPQMLKNLLINALQELKKQVCKLITILTPKSLNSHQISDDQTFCYLILYKKIKVEVLSVKHVYN
ncbi:hypothetical protein BpHYR1_033851 [Brachionus plicatilis]|uniref:Uncharacterized protein n=1 Tax=Brachionus plicatilis TaxID=10195 RepID=A0A3M7T038_BRAPC|nr:hypothetical protein BpHYR1_033851 [Brachionus plicatilis]